MAFILFLIFASLASLLFALLEIQIEGPDGWASRLPTWRIPSPLVLKFFFNPARPLTGYHLYMFSLIFLLLHSYILFTPFTLNFELLILSLFIFILTLEDFLWFILNPHFGLKKFHPKFITWHSRWLLGLPFPYWVGLTFTTVFFLLSQI